MNLAEIRTEFVTLSGRYDLITESGADAGANFFIQSGSRFLDRRNTIQNLQDVHSIVHVQRGRAFVEVPNLWAITEISAMYESMSHWFPLKEMSRRGNLRYAFSQMGPVSHYLISTKRHTQSLKVLPADKMHSPADSMTYSDFDTETINIELFKTPAQNVTLDISGKGYSSPLTADDSTNVWSTSHPDLLVKAALYQLETFYRNSEGAQDWLNAIQLDLIDLDHMQVENEILGRSEMGL